MKRDRHYLKHLGSKLQCGTFELNSLCSELKLSISEHELPTSKLGAARASAEGQKEATLPSSE